MSSSESDSDSDRDSNNDDFYDYDAEQLKKSVAESLRGEQHTLEFFFQPANRTISANQQFQQQKARREAKLAAKLAAVATASDASPKQTSTAPRSRSTGQSASSKRARIAAACFNDLGSDVIGCVFEFLNTEDTVALSLASKLYRAASHQLSAWKQMVILRRDSEYGGVMTLCELVQGAAESKAVRLLSFASPITAEAAAAAVLSKRKAAEKAIALTEACVGRSLTLDESDEITLISNRLVMKAAAPTTAPPLLQYISAVDIYYDCSARPYLIPMLPHLQSLRVLLSDESKLMMEMMNLHSLGNQLLSLQLRLSASPNPELFTLIESTLPCLQRLNIIFVYGTPSTTDLTAVMKMQQLHALTLQWFLLEADALIVLSIMPQQFTELSFTFDACTNDCDCGTSMALLLQKQQQLQLFSWQHALVVRPQNQGHIYHPLDNTAASVSQSLTDMLHSCPAAAVVLRAQRYNPICTQRLRPSCRGKQKSEQNEHGTLDNMKVRWCDVQWREAIGSDKHSNNSNSSTLRSLTLEGGMASDRLLWQLPASLRCALLLRHVCIDYSNEGYHDGEPDCDTAEECSLWLQQQLRERFPLIAVGGRSGLIGHCRCARCYPVQGAGIELKHCSVWFRDDEQLIELDRSCSCYGSGGGLEEEVDEEEFDHDDDDDDYEESEEEG